jgi:LCP family protein required for cell wall assembly
MGNAAPDDFFRQQAALAREQDQPARRWRLRRSAPRRANAARPTAGRARRTLRIASFAVAGLAVLAVAAGGAGYFEVNHLAGSIPRIDGIAALDAAHQPVMPAATRRSMTVLLSGDKALPASGHAGDPDVPSGLIALVHLNANGHGGAVVSIPDNAVVAIPGHGRGELVNALKFGGPSLLITTVEHLTHVRIDHYSEIGFAGTAQVVQAMGGVNVKVPYTVTSYGHTFPAGTDHLTGATALPYVRQPGVSEIGRELLQQNLIRAMLDKIASHHMFSHVTTDYRVLHAMSGALSVDSNFSNSQLERLALRLGHLKGRDGVFVSAPAYGSPASGGTSPVRLNRRLSRKLWRAIRHDAVAAFARRYPSTVTPGAPG